MFLPTSIEELKRLNWHQPDIILISGDVYIDHPYDGVALLGKWLMKHGYKVAVISQPDVNTDEDIMRLGEPKLFWGVSGGCVDSMVANYTALKKPRRSDDMTPGGENNRRPDRAVITYTNLIKKHFKNTVPIVLGGVEASLRRTAHYDYWSDKIRRSVLFDAKADILVYGMAERTILELAERIASGKDWRNIRGICYAESDISEIDRNEYVEIASFDDVKTDKQKFREAFDKFYQNNDPLNALGLLQKQDSRWLVQNPPAYHLSQQEMDEVYDMDFERDVHPYYKKLGKVKSLETIRWSITTHRGCFGDCNFCGITVHQGRTIRSRSENSILSEAHRFTEDPNFKGNISDVGGPSANMWQMSCKKQLSKGSCKDKRCLFPEICKAMKTDHKPQIELLKKMKHIKGIKKVFIGSGIRYDLVIEDKQSGKNYLSAVVEDHVSGQLKIAPEHIDENVLKLMGKPIGRYLKMFKDKFYELSKSAGKKQFLTYYFIAAHPGCDSGNQSKLKQFIDREIKIPPEQVQIFTPTPSTYSTMMYYTQSDSKGKKIFVEKEYKGKLQQKEILQKKRIKEILQNKENKRR